MAEKATHDLDYKAQLERSAYDYNQSIELDELNIEVEKSMTALLKRHHGHEGLVWRKFGGWANYDDERVERDSDHAEWVDKYEGWYTVCLAEGTYAERGS